MLMKNFDQTLTLYILKVIIVLFLSASSWIKHSGNKNKGNDHQLKKLFFVNNLTLGNVLRKQYYYTILGCKGL